MTRFGGVMHTATPSGHKSGRKENKMTIVEKKFEINKWISAAEESWKRDGEASPYTLEDMLMASRMWELLDIAEELSPAERELLTNIRNGTADWSDADSIRRQHSIARCELRWIAALDPDDGSFDIFSRFGEIEDANPTLNTEIK